VKQHANEKETRDGVVPSMIEKLRIHLTRLFAGILSGFILFSRSAWETQAPFLTSLFFFIGIILAGIGTLGRLWCTLYIGGYKTNHLITVGPYSMSRHPLYLFSLIGAIGVGFTSETLLIPAMIAAAFSLYYPFVIRSEEKKLRETHREKFEAYVKTTPVFFPKLSLLTEPQEYKVNPASFKRRLFSSLWFVWLVGILEIIEGLHELGLIPVLFKIY
jgi:protein-S-isoprenylcysteine O-methyltransferase Ste14